MEWVIGQIIGSIVEALIVTVGRKFGKKQRE